jgi:hypothetical protein
VCREDGSESEEEEEVDWDRDELMESDRLEVDVEELDKGKSRERPT